MANTRTQINALWDAFWAPDENPANGLGNELDPADLFLDVSDLGVSCDSPYTPLTCGPHYSFTIVLPTSYQKPGKYDLTDPALSQFSSISECGAPYSSAPDDCGKSFGSMEGGSVEVLSIDEQGVRFVVDVEDPFLWSNPDGDYFAARCP